MQNATKTFVTGILLVVVLGGAYLYFFGGSGQDAPVTGSAENNAAQQQFLNLAAELEPISFDTSLFSDPRFMSLVDFSVTVTAEPQGRTDPFAPIAGLPTGR